MSFHYFFQLSHRICLNLPFTLVQQSKSQSAFTSQLSNAFFFLYAIFSFVFFPIIFNFSFLQEIPHEKSYFFRTCLPSDLGIRFFYYAIELGANRKTRAIFFLSFFTCVCICTSGATLLVIKNNICLELHHPNINIAEKIVSFSSHRHHHWRDMQFNILFHWLNTIYNRNRARKRVAFSGSTKLGHTKKKGDRTEVAPDVMPLFYLTRGNSAAAPVNAASTLNYHSRFFFQGKKKLGKGPRGK